MSDDKLILVKKFIHFVGGLSDEELQGMCEARTNIFCDTNQFFYVFPRNFTDNKDGWMVYDSDGQADVPISTAKMRKQLIEDAEDLLQPVFFQE